MCLVCNASDSACPIERNLLDARLAREERLQAGLLGGVMTIA
jgi:hypothetical protein